MGDPGHKGGSKMFGADEVGPNEGYDHMCVSYDPEYQAELREAGLCIDGKPCACSESKSTTETGGEQDGS